MLHIITLLANLDGLEPVREGDRLQIHPWNARQYKRIIKAVRRIPGLDASGYTEFYGRFNSIVNIWKEI
jgi:hypothetical protein